MKVILTQDVNKLGESGTVQNVKDGYARNYLIPQGLAQMATPGTIKQVEERQYAERRRIELLEESMRDLTDRIEATQLEIQARVGEQGRLYGSVTAAEIATRLSEETGEEIDRRKVELEQPIREVGEFEVPVRLVGRLIPSITVTVFDPDAPLIAEEEAEDEDSDEQTEEVVLEVEASVEDEVDEVEISVDEIEVTDGEAEAVQEESAE